MRLIFLAVFLAIFPLSILSHANAETADALNARGTVEILGYQIPTPVQVDEPNEWEDVRDYVPAVLLETPPRSMTAREIYNEVIRLMRARGAEYERTLDDLAVARQGDYPGQHLETVTLILAETFLASAGEDISPEVQRLALEYSALLYLTDAFKAELEAQGYGPVHDLSEPLPAR